MEKESKTSISIHKEINSSIITFEHEILMNVFYGLIKKFNKELDKSIIEVSKKELWNLMGFKAKNYNSEQVRKIIKQLTKSNIYEISNNEKISGSIFITKELEDYIQIEIPQTFRPYFFNKTDIDLIARAKQNKKLNVKELDYWDTTLKTKKKSLLLLKEADILNVKGKYSKRLYTLLAQWKKIKKYEVNMNKFKETMEIPESYKMSHINSKVLTLSIKEIEEKTDIKNIKIEKKKNGRNIDKLIFTFTVKEVISDGKEPNNEENTQQIQEKEISNISEEVKELKEKLKKKLKGNYELLALIPPLKTNEELKEFAKKYNIEVN